jgi:acyl carrier protein
MTSVDDRVIAVLSRAADLPSGSLTRDARLAALGIGSLEQIECVLALEDELQVELREPDLRALRTVEDVIAAVAKALAERRSAAPPR